MGRYLLLDKIASGGMATVHLGRLVGPAGFTRTVAIKRMHEHLASDPAFIAMFTEEARLAARVRHPNVVSTLDVVVDGGELFLVMEYIHGEALSRLAHAARAANEAISSKLAVTITSGVLHGLHAAHEATDDDGVPLGIIHRDMSPQNVMVGVDGTPRLLDFGIARASSTVESTRDSHFKGKAAYMAPEQLEGEAVGRTVDVYAAGVLLWELLVDRRLFTGETPAQIMKAVLAGDVPPPSTIARDVSPELDRIVMRAIARRPDDRFATARAMALDLEKLGLHMPTSEVGEWVERVAAESIRERKHLLSSVASSASVAEDDMGDVATVVPGVVREASALDRAPVVERTPVRPWTRRRAVLGILLAIGATGGVILGLRTMGASTTPMTLGVVASRLPAPQGEQETPRAAVPSVAPVAPVAPVTSNTNAESEPAPARASTGSTVRKPRASAAASASPPGISATSRVTPSCEPNFFLDDAGLKHFKVECL